MASLWRDLRAGPAGLFLVLSLGAGTFLALTVPAFAGIDEGGHFARTFDLTQGDAVPEAAVDPALVSGVCIPTEVADEIAQGQREALAHALDAAGVDELPGGPPRPVPDTARECGDGESFLQIATFAWYSPVGYGPQVVATGVGRALGLGVDPTLRLARLAVVLTYAAIGTIAVRRSPIARWALAVAGLVPVALFQAATSVSPDAITTAMAILVTSSALRMAAREEVPGRRDLLEAFGLSLVLGLCKPSYAVVALVYLLVVHRHRARASWALLGAPLVGLAVSGVWQRRQSDLFACDVTSFGVAPDASSQLHALVTGPHQFVVGVGRATVESTGGWLDGLVEIGDPRVLSLHPVVIGMVLLALTAVVLLVPDGPGPERLRPVERVGVGGLAVLGFFAVMAGWFVYCNSPGFELDVRPHARLFAPLLPLAAVSLGGLLSRPGPMTTRVAGGVLAVITVAWAFGVATTMG